jgi:hypothetical protein
VTSTEGVAHPLWPETAHPEQDYGEELEDETRALIVMLKHEIGLRWMSVELRMQIERIEVMMGDAGTMAVPPPDPLARE